MIRGVGLYRSMRGRDAPATEKLLQMAQDHVAATKKCKRATMVTTHRVVTLVEEFDSPSELEWELEDAFDQQVSKVKLTRAPLWREYFTDALHISRPPGSKNQETIGILVRQKTSSTDNGQALRDAQKEAYERQMPLEPGCTCCVILAGSQTDASQVRIIELWETMKDFDFHESSEWHAKGEEKVVPLVVDMDCEFVTGDQLATSM